VNLKVTDHTQRWKNVGPPKSRGDSKLEQQREMGNQDWGSGPWVRDIVRDFGKGGARPGTSGKMPTGKGGKEPAQEAKELDGKGNGP